MSIINKPSILAFALLFSLAACAKNPVVDTPPAQAENVQTGSVANGSNSQTVPAASAGKIVADETAGGIMLQSAGKLDTIFFDYDAFVLTADARQVLEKNAKLLRENSAEKIVIKGHTDERGSDAYNLALGERRARAAYDFLVALGIPTGRLSIISYGEEQPAAAGQDEASWAQNRRAEF